MKSANLYIVGYPKSGTSALWSLLRSHENIVVCRKKEAYVLCRNHGIGYVGPRHLELRSPLACRLLYANEFRMRQGRFYLDASPDYISVPGVPRLIKRLAPDAKVLICLREPMSYWRSLHEQWRRMGIFEGEMTLEGDGIDRDGVPADERLNYLAQIKRFTDLFPPDQLRIVLFERFKQDNKAYMRRIWDFLHLSPAETVAYSEPKNYALKVEDKLMMEGRKRLYGEMKRLNQLLMDGGYLQNDLLETWGYDATWISN